jgi:hypothetical protein
VDTRELCFPHHCFCALFFFSVAQKRINALPAPGGKRQRTPRRRLAESDDDYDDARDVPARDADDSDCESDEDKQSK